MKEIVFVARLYRHGKNSLGFYVPSNVMEYFDLTTETPVKATMAWRPNYKIRDAPISFTKYKDRIRGLVKGWSIMPEAGTLVELRLVVGK